MARPSFPINQISEPDSGGHKGATGQRRQRFALFDLGLRPFYLLAAWWSSLSVLAWGLAAAGILPLQVSMSWHAHEMLFGFTAAIIVGFLLTAVGNWTGRDTASGTRLAALCALWIVARIAGMVGPGWFGASANALFFVASTLELLRVMIPGGKPKNLLFPAALLVMGAVSTIWNMAPASAYSMARVGMGAIVVVVIVMSGRVIPGFTRANLQRQDIANTVWVERGLLAAALAMFALDALQFDQRLVALIALAGTVLALARSLRWKPWATRSIALLWMLHLSHAWLIVWFALRALGGLGFPMADAMALHALTVGLIGGICLAMMMRTARGHTGRAVIASGWDVAAFSWLMLAALARVIAPLFPASYVMMMALSGAMWALAFGIFALAYLPILGMDKVRQH